MGILMVGAYITGILSIAIGLLWTPVPKELGFYRFLATLNPMFVGLNPAFHHGIPWGYTWEEWYADQDRLVGKMALVTGANSGIGYDLVEALAILVLGDVAEEVVADGVFVPGI